MKIKFKIIAVFMALSSLSGFISYSYAGGVSSSKIPLKEIIMHNEPLLESIGIIYFPKYNQKNEIVYGTYQAILDEDVIGMEPVSENLDKENNHIILAGHNKKGVFSVLHKLKKDDEVVIYSHNNTYKFTVKNIEIVEANQLLYHDDQKNHKLLTLITCTNNNASRLIINLEEKNSNKNIQKT